MGKALDVVTIGRSSVDLYGQQIGSRLQDIGSFAKSVGGCPTNIAIGTSRLGLRAAVITRVGAEQMGDYIREQLAREGVVTDGVAVDPERLTALVLLAVQDEGVSPMIFYRTDCADMALSEADIDETLVASARAVVVTGTHFSRPHSEAAQRKAIRIARASGGKVVFDIDYRPNLWGLGSHADGFGRYVKSDAVSARLRSILPECDLVIGTEEEVLIASGAETLEAALRDIRAISSATIVLKRGAMGCIVYDGPIPDDLEQGILGRGFPIEVYNVLGAGDAFMSGFLRGWLRDEPLATCATWANACGAFAVSRLLCSPEYPTWAELSHFLEKGSRYHALRKDPALTQLHWATTRRPQPERLMAFAIDHRSQLEEMADKVGAPRDRIATFKQLAVDATARVADGRPGFGMLLDSTYGTRALYRAGRHPVWIARPVEQPGSRPLDFDDLPDLGSHLAEWPVTHTVKCLCFYHPDDPAELRARQDRELLRVYDAARTAGRELLVEIIAGKHGALADDTVARVITHLYGLGIHPDWWKLEAQPTAAAWRSIGAAIEAADPLCRGVLLLGLDAPEAQLAASMRLAAGERVVKGFAIGRTLFADAARRWLAGEIDDAAAVDDMAARFTRMVEVYRQASGG
jgi:5-dehydro-2-deoxygluconokinase